MVHSPRLECRGDDPAIDSWITKSPMPTPHLGVGAAVGGGGSWVEVYHPGTNSWTAKAPTPRYRALLAVGILNGGLYVVGGYGPDGYEGAVLVYFP